MVLILMSSFKPRLLKVNLRWGWGSSGVGPKSLETILTHFVSLFWTPPCCDLLEEWNDSGDNFWMPSLYMESNQKNYISKFKLIHKGIQLNSYVIALSEVDFIDF